MGFVSDCKKLDQGGGEVGGLLRALEENLRQLILTGLKEAHPVEAFREVILRRIVQGAPRHGFRTYHIGFTLSSGVSLPQMGPGPRSGWL